MICLVDPDGGIVAHLTERTLGQMMREQMASLKAAAEDPSKQPLYIPEAFDTLVKRVSNNVRPPDNPIDTVIRIAEHLGRICANPIHHYIRRRR